MGSKSPARRGGGAVLAIVLAIALATMLACSLPNTDPATVTAVKVGRCPSGTLPCGNGCMPKHAECCDDGSRRTSSYCPDPSAGPCQRNDRSCKKTGVVLSGSDVADFCCGNTALTGSQDCPEGQHHCGSIGCKALSEPCCPDGATTAECPYERDLVVNGVGCQKSDGSLCGHTGGDCWMCPPGSCCAAKQVGDGYRCIPQSNVCTGIPGSGGGSSGTSGSDSGASGSGSSGSSGSCNGCRLVWDCKSSSQCATVYGAPTGCAAEPDKATCEAVCKMQGACTCEGCL